MGQNTSSAVMQQRREDRDSLDDFPTPPWATRVLMKFLFVDLGWPLDDMTCREPAANRGIMSRTLAEQFPSVEASDVYDYGVGLPVDDYLFPGALPMVDATITNPPFRLAEAFIARALATSSRGVAMFVRLAFIEGEERHEKIFLPRPPSHILQFSERVIIHAKKLVDPNKAIEVIDPDTGEAVINERTGRAKKKKPSSATAYCWAIWDNKAPRVPYARLYWTGKVRERFERPRDYDLSRTSSGV
jgi:hypothetical protein